MLAPNYWQTRAEGLQKDIIYGLLAYIERIHQMSYSSLSDNGVLQIFSFLIK